MYALVTWTAFGERTVSLPFRSFRLACEAGVRYLAAGCTAYRVRRVG